MTPVRKALGFVPAALYYAGIFGLSAKSSFPFQELFSGFDKIVHIGEFAGLGFLLAWALFRLPSGPGPVRARRPAAWAGALGTALGLMDEFHQVFVPGRHPDLLDAAADVVGIGLGIGLLVVLRRRSGF